MVAGKSDFRDLRRLEERLARAGNEVAFEMRRAFERDGARWRREMTRRTGGEVLNVRTGSLRRSFGFLVQGVFAAGRFGGRRLVDLELRKYTTSPYGPAHEFGAVIFPVDAQLLTIPVGPALTPSGVPRRPSARDWEDLFWISTDRVGSANIVARLVQKQPDGTLETFYLGAEYVELEESLGMRETHEGQRFQRERDIREAIRRALSSPFAKR